MISIKKKGSISVQILVIMMVLNIVSLNLFLMSNECYKQRVRRNRYLCQEAYLKSTTEILDHAHYIKTAKMLSDSWDTALNKYNSEDNKEQSEEQLAMLFENAFYRILDLYGRKYTSLQDIPKSSITKNFRIQEGRNNSETVYEVLYYEHNEKTRIFEYKYSTACPKFTTDDVKDAYLKNWTSIIKRHDKYLKYETVVIRNGGKRFEE